MSLVRSGSQLGRIFGSIARRFKGIYQMGKTPDVLQNLLSDNNEQMCVIEIEMCMCQEHVQYIEINGCHIQTILHVAEQSRLMALPYGSNDQCLGGVSRYTENDV